MELLLAVLGLSSVSFPKPAVSKTSTTYIVDTGPGPDYSCHLCGVYVFYDLNQVPDPEWQFLSAKFTTDKPTFITGIEGWMHIDDPGYLTFKIYNDGGEVPGTKTLFSKTQAFAATSTSWQGIDGLHWKLKPGDYWVSFEAQPGFFGAMPQPSTSPLKDEVYSGATNGSWIENDNLDLGIRIEGTTIPSAPHPIANPIPSAVILMGIGLGRLVLFSRRKRTDKN